jgi:hypothetical protein
MSALLRVERPVGKFGRDTLRSYKVIVDGVVVGKLARGATVEVSLPRGGHSLRIKGFGGGGSETVQFSVERDETACFVCRWNMALGLSGAWQAVAAPRTTLALERQSG